jgi:hypothetical protein
MFPGDATHARLVLVAVIAAAVAAGAALADRAPRVTFAQPPQVASSGAPLAPSLCPPGSLPDDGVCIPVPPPERATLHASSSERIPRRPDRPPEYARYELPVDHAASIADLGESAAPDGGVKPSGIGIQVAPGRAVSAVTLDGQDGPARIVYEGTLWGPTVVTLHTVHAGGVTQQYLVALAGLATLLPRALDETVSAGAQLGTSGASQLILETRLLRPGVDVRPLSAASMLAEGASVATDPRNVLSTAR